MPMTEKFRAQAEYLSNASLGVRYLSNEEKYAGNVAQDTSAIREGTKNLLTNLNKALFASQEAQANQNDFINNLTSDLYHGLSQVSMYASVDLVAQVTQVLSNPNPEFTEEILDFITSAPEVLEVIGTTMFDTVADSDAIDKSLEEVKRPELSSEAHVYATTGESVYDVIKNITPTKKIEEMKEELDAGSYIKNTSDFFKKQYDQKQAAYDRAISFNKSIDRDASVLLGLLNGLTPLDGEAYNNRLADIISYVSRTDATKSVFSYVGADRQSLSTVENASRYVHELISRSNFMEGKKTELLSGVDFNQLTEAAREKNAETSAEEIESKISDLRHIAKSTEVDASVIAGYFKDCDTEEKMQKAYAKVVADAASGKVEFDGLQVNGKSQSDLAKISEYVVRCAKSEQIAIELVSSDYMKKICDRQLNASNNAQDMLFDFNQALNRFAVEGAEMVALATKQENTKTYQLALAKTEGLSRDVDSKLLEDAIGVYARLKEVHAHRTTWQKIRHPFRNRDENNAIKKMEDVLTKQFGFSREGLETAARDALQNADDPISRAARKAEDFEKAMRCIKAAQVRREQRLEIIRNKIAGIEAPKAGKVAEEKVEPEVKEKAPEQKEKTVDLTRLQKLSEPEFKKLLNKNLAIERRELEERARKDGKITEEKRAEIDQKIQNIEKEYIQLHVDPKGYMDDLNAAANDDKKRSMEKAVIEAIPDKETRDRLKAEHKLHEEIRERNAELYKEREELREEYFKAADLEDRFGLDMVQKSAEQESLERVKNELNFTDKLEKDIKSNEPNVEPVVEAEAQPSKDLDLSANK